MSFLNLSVAESSNSQELPDQVNIVTALHACNTATDDAIDFALQKQAQFIVLVPCCQAEVAAFLKQNRDANPAILNELWQHPIHSREFGSHITNVLRCLRLEAAGYKVTATELIGWEHSMKNELIVASYQNRLQTKQKAQERLSQLITTLGLEKLSSRFNKL